MKTDHRRLDVGVQAKKQQVSLPRRRPRGRKGLTAYAIAFGSGCEQTATGKPLTRQNVRKRSIAACSVLGKERQAELTIHHGRHSFCSHALAGGRTLPEVRDAAGHANIATTSVYAHVPVDDDDGPGDLFDF